MNFTKALDENSALFCNFTQFAIEQMSLEEFLHISIGRSDKILVRRILHKLKSMFDWRRLAMNEAITLRNSSSLQFDDKNSSRHSLFVLRTLERKRIQTPYGFVVDTTILIGFIIRSSGLCIISDQNAYIEWLFELKNRNKKLDKIRLSREFLDVYNNNNSNISSKCLFWSIDLVLLYWSW